MVTDPAQAAPELIVLSALVHGKGQAGLAIGKSAVAMAAGLDAATRITLTEDEPPHMVNSVPSKFLPRFDSVQAARDELAQLTRFAGVDTRLEPGPL